MYLTDTDFDLLHAWAKSDKLDKVVFLNRKNAFNCVIFGADEAQRRYLEFVDFAVHLEGEFGDSLQTASVAKNAAALKKEFSSSAAATIGKNKETSPRVSNYWLKPVQAVAATATEQASGKSSPDSYVAAATKGSPSDVGKFWGRFASSPHDLGHKVIPGVKTDGEKFVSPKAAGVTKSGAEKSVQHYVYDFAVRRACKFLMYDAKASKRPVFYTLDGLDLNIIVDLIAPTGAIRNEVKVGKTEDEKKVPICTSELRELFRYWDSFCNDEVAFLKDFKVVAPPWSVNVDKWGAYAVQRALKLRLCAEAAGKADGLPTADEIRGWSGATAIEKYHQLKPSRFRGLQPLNSIVSGKETL